MSGLEIPGLVLGVVGVVAAFKGAVDSALLIDSFFDDREAGCGCGYLALTYHIEKTRLQLWGELCKVDDESQADECALRDKPEYLKKIIVRILGEITSLNEQAERLVAKYDIGMPPLPDLDLNDNLATDRALPKALSKLSIRTKPKSSFRWTIQGRAQFQQVVSKLSKLVGDLHSLSLHAGGPELPDRALPSRVLASIKNPHFLDLLDDEAENQAVSVISLSARAKTLQQDLTDGVYGTASAVTRDQLVFLTDSTTIGLLTRLDGETLPVWVEWTVLDMGPEYYKFAGMISALGHVLEQVSDPALRLPPCHGVYEDAAYERQHGKRRLGYVFGLPRRLPGRGAYAYESDIQRHPPRTLSQLIADRKAPIPLLGDRFRLAYALATAFSNFHGAGWLHKGLHSGNIVFLQRAGGGISVTDPFITGFQYSRPINAVSQPHGPLQEEALAHYYHPDAQRGFTKQRDLYGLGVVLCEIGRWGLVAETVSASRRKKLTTPAAWREYMVTVVAEDMGWRMGKAYQDVVRTLLECRLPAGDEEGNEAWFVHQFLERVLQPLGTCCA